MRARPLRRRALEAAAALLLAACHDPSSAAPTPAPTPAPAPTPTPAPAPAPAYHAHPVPDGHALDIRLTYAGKPPAPWKIPAPFASHCGGATDVPDPSVEADAKGGVTGAVVWLDDLHEGEPVAPADAVLDQKACAFAPHVLAMAAGSKLVLANDDPANHAVRLDFLPIVSKTTIGENAGDESVVKMLPPGSKDAIPTSAAWAGRVGRITCPIHPWMLAWVHFFDSPYFAVTRDGVARIAKVPPGTWHLSVWHEALDAKMGDTVTEGPPIRARFDVTVRDRDVAKALTLRDDGTIR